jgi:quercetin dioxygenase-like cupin family protein
MVKVRAAPFNLSHSLRKDQSHGPDQAPAMNKNLLQWTVLSSLLWLIGASSEACARDNRVKVDQLLQTTGSWDGTRYTRYVSGQPQITVLRIRIPAHTALGWHEHPMISAAYIVSGQLTVEIRGRREHQTLHSGQALAESVDTVHRGYTTDQPVELVVFYAGAVGLPLTIKAKWRPLLDGELPKQMVRLTIR